MTESSRNGRPRKSGKKRVRRVVPKGADDPRLQQPWRLRLYVAGNTALSVNALRNLQALCEAHLKGRYRIEVVDLLRKPQQAGRDQILAIPTLVRRLPTPIKRIIGDLSDVDRVLMGLELRNPQRKEA